MATRIRPGSKPNWTISVLSADGLRMLFHGECEDRKEVQALATEARSRSLGYKIFIHEPGDGESYSWD